MFIVDVWRKQVKVKGREIQEADDDVIYVDTLNLEAVTTGYVSLWPDRRLNTAIYCRWLRLLIEDLFCFSPRREVIDCVWYSADVNLRLGMWGNIFYETLRVNDHYMVLKVSGHVSMCEMMLGIALALLQIGILMWSYEHVPDQQQRRK